ncbi:Ger(x)C family spore germination protein [Halalkalibacterium halodurans]|uniref:Ger(x)C family spore germination protein n=1 Tax=Halalkalibacterium halodurans TaxID=86665 RepID=UPI002AA96B89|nr:Ger(x)C family spore germination protein [Halalkalibacterium halodurans]MDY7221634.1 Ger(x)C family spore germination protein [Halalkalibacterium halodurans]MDY7240910.1 Ger(x)C family spore germination protein [Halalkalibacterium halodurans]
MKKYLSRLLVLCLLFSLMSCDGLELTERAFVIGLALDETEAGNIMLTTQLYRPSPEGAVGQMGGGKAGQNYLNIQTSAESITKALRNIPMHIGRKAQWSHISSILVAESLAEERGVAELLEFFYRDHEPRIISSIAVTEGKASDFLNIAPLMEMTPGHQLLVNEEGAHTFANKSIETTLLKIALQLRSEVGNAVIPLIHKEDVHPQPSATVSGVGLLKDGKLVDKLSPDIVEYLQIIRTDYQNGMIQFPCPGKKEEPQQVEVIEVVSMDSAVRPIIEGDSLRVSIPVRMEVVIQELACSETLEPEQEQEFVEYISQFFEQQILTTVATLQEKNFDAINIGNKIYGKDPQKWKEWKGDWDERFAKAEFSVDVQLRVINTGTMIGKPTFTE